MTIGLTLGGDASKTALPKPIRAGRLPAGRAAVLVWRGRHDTLPKGARGAMATLRELWSPTEIQLCLQAHLFELHQLCELVKSC